MEQKSNPSDTNQLLLAIVGMPGAGKSEVTSYLQKKGLPFVRFGELTDKGLREQGLTLNPENEKKFREDIRRELGMAAYAIKAEPVISQLLLAHAVVVIDGLYSWEEYKYLKEKFPSLTLVQIYARPTKRYERLQKRSVRPLTPSEARKRDIAELENLNKGGPIAIADYLIENNSDTISDLEKSIETILTELSVERKI